MKKTLLYIAVLASVVAPSVTFASWYNPLSWFHKTPETVQVQPQIEAKPTLVLTPKPIETKPVITNTITVTDPKLQSQINELAKNNTDLQIQLASLTTQYNALIKEDADLKLQIAGLKASQKTTVAVQVPEQSQCEIDRDAKIKNLNQQIADAKVSYYAKIAEIQKTATGMDSLIGQESQETNKLNLLTGSLQAQIDQAKISCN